MTLRRLASTATSSSQVNTGMAILRVMLGVVMVAHGWQTLFQFGIAVDRSISSPAPDSGL